MAKKGGRSSAAKKRTVNGKRGKPGRGQSMGSAPNIRGVVGIIIMCVGLLLLVSQFIPSSALFISQLMLFVRGMGGLLCLLLPMVICWIGVTLVFSQKSQLNVRLCVCAALIFVFVETILQVLETNSTMLAGELGYLDYLTSASVKASLDCRGGGFIGALLAWPLVHALGDWGTIILLVCAVIASLMVMTGVAFNNVGMYLSQVLDDWRVAYAERREEKEALREKEEEERLARETEMAEERQRRRTERAARQETAFAREPEETETPQREELPKDERRSSVKKKRRPEREVVNTFDPSVVETAWQPQNAVLEPERSAYAPAPERNAYNGWQPSGNTLFIESEDAFAPLDAQQLPPEPEIPSNRYGSATFTPEEAERAFLYGLGNANGAQQQKRDDSAYRRPAAPQQAAAVQQPQRAQNVQRMQNAQYSQYGKPVETAPKKQTVWHQPQRPAQQSAAQSVQETESPVVQPEATVWQPEAAETVVQPEAVIEPEIQDTQEYADYIAEEIAAQTQDEPETSEDLADSDDSEYPQAEDTQDEEPEEDVPWAEEEPEIAPTRPESEKRGDPFEIFRRAEAEAAKRQPQNVLAQPEEPQVIVQLREGRADGTPLVLPKKDTHQAPKAPEIHYEYPPMDLLNKVNNTQDPNARAKIEADAQKLLETLESFGVQAKLIHVTRGPAITRYELQPAPGVKVSRIVNLVDDIALNMASDGVRIEAPIPGKPAVGIEIPNEKIEMVSLRDVLESPEMMREKSPTAVALGKSISGAPVVADMAKMPHVLIAGATGSGKSVCINTIINSIIYRADPKEVRLILVDPKVVELSVYNGIPHLLIPVVTDPKKASAALSWAVVEMEHRYKRFETMGVRNIQGYNNAIGPDEEPMSKIIVIIDELADLMMVAPGEVEESICRLAQLARAAGIHLVIATQRPSVNVITGVIKANIPSRIAFAVSSQIDSRTILDTGGAEKLLGKGDMLYAPQGAGKPTRVQGCFVSDDEVQRIVDFVRGRHEASYSEEVIEQMNAAQTEEKAAGNADTKSESEQMDEMLVKAIDLAVEAGQVSISMLQRRLRVGYARAGRLVDEMTQRGITGEAEGPTKPRNVLIKRDEWERMKENGL